MLEPQLEAGIKKMNLLRNIVKAINEIKMIEFVPKGVSIKYDFSFPEAESDSELLVNLAEPMVIKFET